MRKQKIKGLTRGQFIKRFKFDPESLVFVNPLDVLTEKPIYENRAAPFYQLAVLSTDKEINHVRQGQE